MSLSRWVRSFPPAAPLVAPAAGRLIFPHLSTGREARPAGITVPRYTVVCVICAYLGIPASPWRYRYSSSPTTLTPTQPARPANLTECGPATLWHWKHPTLLQQKQRKSRSKEAGYVFVSRHLGTCKCCPARFLKLQKALSQDIIMNDESTGISISLYFN